MPPFTSEFFYQRNSYFIQTVGQIYSRYMICQKDPLLISSQSSIVSLSKIWNCSGPLWLLGDGRVVSVAPEEERALE